MTFSPWLLAFAETPPVPPPPLQFPPLHQNSAPNPNILAQLNVQWIVQCFQQFKSNLFKRWRLQLWAKKTLTIFHSFSIRQNHLDPGMKHLDCIVLSKEMFWHYKPENKDKNQLHCHLHQAITLGTRKQTAQALHLNFNLLQSYKIYVASGCTQSCIFCCLQNTTICGCMCKRGVC